MKFAGYLIQVKASAVSCYMEQFGVLVGRA
jgi:hypothetical protein